MKKRLTRLAAVAALCTFSTSALADTSYFLIQGPFGESGATETFKWKITYDPGSYTGGDLLRTILGTPVDTGTKKDGNTYWVSGTETLGAAYVTFFGTLLLDSITANGTAVETPADWSANWHYNVAGGSGLWKEDPDTNPDGLYADGVWSYPDDSFETRRLADGSFDAWVFGTGLPENNYEFYVDGLLNEPLETYFADAVDLTMIPEPGSLALVFAGVGSLWWAGRRRRAK